MKNLKMFLAVVFSIYFVSVSLILLSESGIIGAAVFPTEVKYCGTPPQLRTPLPNDTYTLVENDTFNLILYAKDYYGDTLAYDIDPDLGFTQTISQSGPNGSLELDWVVGPSDYGTEVVTITVGDSGESCDHLWPTFMFTLYLPPPPAPPPPPPTGAPGTRGCVAEYIYRDWLCKDINTRVRTIDRTCRLPSIEEIVRCPTGQVCRSGQCVSGYLTAMPPPNCGNRVCDRDETCENCPWDCGECLEPSRELPATEPRPLFLNPFVISLPGPGDVASEQAGYYLGVLPLNFASVDPFFRTEPTGLAKLLQRISPNYGGLIMMVIMVASILLVMWLFQRADQPRIPTEPVQKPERPQPRLNIGKRW